MKLINKTAVSLPCPRQSQNNFQYIIIHKQIKIVSPAASSSALYIMTPRIKIKETRLSIYLPFLFSSCAVGNYNCAITDPEPNPNQLIGGLVGGPNSNDVYNDHRDDYVTNDVATDYNAGFQSAVAGWIFLN